MDEPHTGAEHLLAARHYATAAARSRRTGDLATAAVLASIGQVHATIAQAAALALPAVTNACGDSWDIIAWARAIGHLRDDDPAAATSEAGGDRATASAGLRAVG